jgi:hypothetical protein
MSDKIKDGAPQGREIAASALMSLACSDDIMDRALAVGIALWFIEVSAGVLATTVGSVPTAKILSDARDSVLATGLKIEGPAGSA